MILKPYFRSNGYTPNPIIISDSGDEYDLSKLPAFLRTLLVMDGTVTKALEAWFWEPVEVISLQNKQTDLTMPAEELEAQQGDQILQREVKLQGVNTGQIFACARSTVALEQLPTEIAQALKTGQIGIGELFREKGLETYRDIFNINHYQSAPEKDELLSHLNNELVSRSYRIWVNGSSSIIVNEFFPVSIY